MKTFAHYGCLFFGAEFERFGFSNWVKFKYSSLSQIH
jgi:hypothetical protein